MLWQIYTPYRSFLSFIYTILTKLISYKLVLKKSYGYFWTQFADVLQILSFLQAGGNLPRLSVNDFGKHLYVRACSFIRTVVPFPVRTSWARAPITKCLPKVSSSFSNRSSYCPQFFPKVKNFILCSMQN